MARLTRPVLLLPLCILLGWSFDLLFWNRSWGVSFLVFVAIVLAVGLWQARRLGLRPTKSSWPLAALALAFAATGAVRAEPFTLFLTRAFSLLFLMLFAANFLSGDWLRYRFSDFAARLLSLVPAGLLAGQAAKPKRAGRGGGAQKLAPVLRGLMLALPVLLLLGSLLVSADAYFAEWIDDVFGFLRIERLSEYVFRLAIILIVAYCIFGSLLYAFLRSKSGVNTQKPLLPPFIGFTETMTVLTSVAALLASFVIIQFRYFFGGVSNVLASNGFTYAQYARQGFAELCLAAVVILVLFIALSAWVKRKPAQQKYFSAAGIVLFALVSVVLVSAFQRLLLYEEAYGFTRMRTIPHVFMVWLGVLLLALVLLELAGRQRHFAAAVLLAAAGFALTFPLLNMDAFIVRANVAHSLARSQPELDAGYLGGLSADAVPALANSYLALQVSGDDARARQLAVALTCIALRLDEFAPLGWPSWSLARQRAQETWLSLSDSQDFPHAQTRQDKYGQLFVSVGGSEYACQQEGWD